MGTAKSKLIKLVRHPLFSIGLIIRLSLLFLVVPFAASEWYAPFLDLSLSEGFWDPWQTHLSSGGAPAAFPYGYVMWLVLLPGTLICSLAGINVIVGYMVSMLCVDLFLLMLLKIYLQVQNRLLLVAYWLSPIVIIATYWLGFNDLIPVAFLCVSLYALRSHKPIITGFFCGAAISAKLSMILPVPFIVIYLIRNRALRHLISGYAIGISIALVIFCLPFALSSAGVMMLIHNPEMQKTYAFSFQLNENLKIYLLPLAYFLTLYIAWHVRRITFDLFNAILSIAFLLVLIFTPAAPGWFIWFLPLVLSYLAHGKKTDTGLIIGFSTVYVISVLLVAQQPTLLGTSMASDAAVAVRSVAGERGISLLNTVLMAIGLVLALRIWRGAISENDYFRLSRKPLVVGVAGDSGAGKDFLVAAMIDLFGKHSAVHISGDDYHLWDRHKPMWQVLTHLNPKAYDLERFTKDLFRLIDGKTIYSAHYDHATGKMTLPRRLDSNDFIMASGLHTLHLPSLRECYDLSIYLDIDEGLRRYFKIERDVKQRGHSVEKVLSSIDRREEDSELFVRPQAQYADLILSVKPSNPRSFEKANKQLNLKLSVVSRLGMDEESLKRVLVGVCGLYVDSCIAKNEREVEFTIEGDTTGEDIEMAAKTLFPNIVDFLDTSPVWKDGISGLMQLVILSHINQSLNKRLL